MEFINLLAQLLYVVCIFAWWLVKFIIGRLFSAGKKIRHFVQQLLKQKVHTRSYRSRKWHVTQINFYKNHTKYRSHPQMGLMRWIREMIDPDLEKTQSVIHQPIFARLPKVRMSKNFKKKVLPKLSVAGMVVTGVVLFGLLFPDIALKVIPYRTEPIVSAVDESVLGGKFEEGTLNSKVELPEKNEYLPTGNWLVIPKIGVRTLINEESYDDHEKALEKGVWRVPDFADPMMEKKFPMILVAHKFGYLKWSNNYRHKNSFYNLDGLEIGDTFEVIWDQRRFTYEVYAGEQGEEITDYKADVILYTCKYLNSPVRIFRYARRVG